MRNHSKPYKIAFCECPSVFPMPLTSTALGYYFIKSYLRLVLHDTELADPVVKGNMRIPDSQSRHKPLIVISAVRTVYHTLMIGLDNSKILKG